MEAAIRKAKRDGKIPRTVQQSIPYREIYPDGICNLDGRRFSKAIEFFDLNYHLAQDEDKDQIFQQYCEVLNYFDPAVAVQLSFVNQKADRKISRKSVEIPQRADGLNHIRKEYTGIIGRQLANGGNGLEKRKFLTMTVQADSLRDARLRFERLESDVLSGFQSMGVQARPLSGLERLTLLHKMFHPGDGEEPFFFNWDAIVQTGISTKDFVAPMSFHFGGTRHFQMGDQYGAVSYLQITAPELSDRLLTELLDMENPVTVNMHIQSMDHTGAVKLLKQKLSDLDKMRMDEQKKAFRGGWDADILPPDLQTYGKEVRSLLENLQSRNERLFLVTFLICNTAPSRQALDSTVLEAAGIAQKHNCALRRMDFQQETGLMSSLPLGLNQIAIQRTLTTSSTAIFVPFMTRELMMEGAAVYYGRNALSGNPITADRKRLRNSNGIIMGTPGSGKSFMAKREMVHVLLATQDDVVVTDPEGEYAPLIRHFGGQEVVLSPNSKHYLNPLDLSVNYGDDEDPLTLKSDFVLSLCELVVGGKSGLKPVEKTVIDRCTRLVYRKYLENPKPENMPILGDLHKLLLKQSEPEAKDVAKALEIYVSGSLNLFNHHTNVDLTNRFVCFNIKMLGKSLKKLAMLILQDQVWNKVTANRDTRIEGNNAKATWYYADEFHLLLKDEQTAAYCVEIWKRFRKWGGVPTALTQNATDFLRSPEIGNILENSDTIILLNTGAEDRKILAAKLNISPHQLSYVTHSGAGEGLYICDGTIIPFRDRFPKNSTLYRAMTTKPGEVESAG